MRPFIRLLHSLLLLFTLPVQADTYFRQPALDVVHYEIAVELKEGSDEISGTARVHVLIQQDDTLGMWFDLEGMNVDRLQVGGMDRPFTHRYGRLTFQFDRAYQQHEIAIVEVRYHGTPKGKGMLIGKNKNSRQVYFAENWPDRAHYWFPSIDHPHDKATVEFAITAPEKYDIVANGRLIETRSFLDGRKLTRWSESVPVPTYCMVIGVAEFSIVHAESVVDIPLTFYSYPQDAAAAAHKFARSKLVVQYFNDLIGPYPFEKLAQVQSTTSIGGMENSSVIFYAEPAFQRPEIRESPVPHEIAHQWFGDSVTESDWDHLWLSEGFATYFSALFYEHLKGKESMKRAMASAAEAVRQYHQKRPVALIDPELTDPMKKLNAFNYQKGAWALHMLRRVLGDETFFKGIRRYYNLYAGKTASTEDFQKVMEAVSGSSLAGFFRQWFYQPGWPDYRVVWRWNEATAGVELVFHQEQSTGLFDMPLEIAFRLDDRRELRTVRVSTQDQTVRVPLPHKPASVEVDPDGWVLKSIMMTEIR